MKSNSEQGATTIFWRIPEWFPELPLHQQASLKTYHDELIKANRTINLIGPKTIFVADALHFADSILGYMVLKNSGVDLSRITCVGVGNGFPGLVMAILNENIKITILDTDSKRIEFLNHIIESLNLKNVVVQNKTLEQMEDGSVSLLIGRSFGSISKGILAGRKAVPKGGVFYHFKSEEWGVEVSDIPSQLCSIWSPSLVGDYKLPVGNIKFSIVKTDKIA